jgi:hypothetical protein
MQLPPFLFPKTGFFPNFPEGFQNFSKKNIIKYSMDGCVGAV